MNQQAPRPAPGLVTTVRELDEAPHGYLAVDKDLLVFTKPFNGSNMWRLGGFAELLPATAISLPARLHRIMPDGRIIQSESETTS